MASQERVWRWLMPNLSSGTFAPIVSAIYRAAPLKQSFGGRDYGLLRGEQAKSSLRTPELRRTDGMDAGEVERRGRIRQGGSQQRQHAPAVEALSDDSKTILGCELCTERNRSEFYVWWRVVMGYFALCIVSSRIQTRDTLLSKQRWCGKQEFWDFPRESKERRADYIFKPLHTYGRVSSISFVHCTYSANSLQEFDLSCSAIRNELLAKSSFLQSTQQGGRWFRVKEFYVKTVFLTLLLEALTN